MGNRHLGIKSNTRCPYPQLRSGINVDVETLMKKLRSVDHPSDRGGIRPVDPELPGRVTIFNGPVDRFSLRFEGSKNVVAVIFDYIIVDRGSLAPTLGTGLNVNIRHVLLPITPASVRNGDVQCQSQYRPAHQIP